MKIAPYRQLRCLLDERLIVPMENNTFILSCNLSPYVFTKNYIEVYRGDSLNQSL